jgi:transposase-like protein
MKAEDFSAWLSAISGMSEGQRREAVAALEKASGALGAGGSSAKAGGKRSRQEDALGTTSVERVAAQGCPHCAGREVVGWGRSHGLLRFRCKSCGRTFNALTKTPMAHLRKKEKWLDHARAMIEEKAWRRPRRSAASIRRRPSAGVIGFCVPLRATSPEALEGLSKPTKPSFSNPSRGAGPICRAGRASEAERPGIRAFTRTTFPSSSPATATAPPSTRSCLRSTALR